MTNFDRVVMFFKDLDLQNIHLYIILMETAEDSGERMSTIADYVKSFIANTPSSRIHLIEVENGNFTRELFPRIRHHTIYNKQVYFPIIFSQYDPNYWENPRMSMNFASFYFRGDIGYWRQYGFGIWKFMIN